MLSDLSPSLRSNINLSLQFTIKQLGFETASEYIPSTVDAFISSCRESAKEHLQSSLTHRAHENFFDKYIDSFSNVDNEESKFHFVRLKHLQVDGAYQWKSILPIIPSLHCSDDQYIIQSRLHLGLKPHPDLPRLCPFRDCARSMSDATRPSTYLHPLCCPTLLGTSITNRHNSIQHAVELHCEHAGGYVSFSSSRPCRCNEKTPSLIR
jgi:hypothetical protein